MALLPVIAMFRRPFAALLAFGATLCAGYAPTGEAPSERQAQQRPAPAPQQPAAGISLQDAIAIVRQTYGGRIVSAKAHSADGRADGYRVRVDVDGRVKTVHVDLRGRILEQGG